MTRDSIPLQNRRDVLTCAGALGVTALAGCVGTSDNDGGSEDAYTVGMIDSLTGSLADFGERNQRAVELALEHVNDVGVKGQNLEIIIEDSESEAQPGVSAAQKLVNQNSQAPKSKSRTLTSRSSRPPTTWS